MATRRTFNTQIDANLSRCQSVCSRVRRPGRGSGECRPPVAPPNQEKESPMKKQILCSVIATGMMVGLSSGVAEAAKPKKQESEVQKSLKAAYPDAETQITGTNDVNGVKVHDVSVKTKDGESTAQVTEYGDFLMYGVPHEYGSIRRAIQQDIGGVFKSTPE